MRKYRIWDKRGGCFVSEYENTVGENRLEHFVDCDGKLRKFIYGVFDGVSEDNIIDPENHVVQYSTGMSDKDGKEIYEGDILFNPIWNSSNTVEFGARRVFSHRDSLHEWHYSVNNGFLLRSATTGKMNSFEFDEDEVEDKDGILRLQKIVIVGNIFENPELIKL